MNYVIADAGLAMAKGIKAMGHKFRAGLMMLNEREVTNCPALSGTLDERAAAIKGTVLTDAEVKETLSKGGWKYE